MGSGPEGRSVIGGVSEWYPAQVCKYRLSRGGEKRVVVRILKPLLVLSAASPASKSQDVMLQSGRGPLAWLRGSAWARLELGLPFRLAVALISLLFSTPFMVSSSCEFCLHSPHVTLFEELPSGGNIFVLLPPICLPTCSGTQMFCPLLLWLLLLLTRDTFISSSLP